MNSLYASKKCKYFFFYILLLADALTIIYRDYRRKDGPMSSVRSTITNRRLPRWEKRKVNPDNDGKMPIIVFGAGMFGQVGKRRYKGHPSGVVGKLWKSLKSRERQLQCLVVTIDEYLSSQVRKQKCYFVVSDYCCCIHH